MENWERQEMAFLREENKRLTVQNEMLQAEIRRCRKDAETEKERFVQECMACELRRAAPVVYGQWGARIRHEHYPSGEEHEADYCSVCGKRGRMDPNCGVKMDG